MLETEMLYPETLCLVSLRLTEYEHYAWVHGSLNFPVFFLHSFWFVLVASSKEILTNLIRELPMLRKVAYHLTTNRQISSLRLIIVSEVHIYVKHCDHVEPRPLLVTPKVPALWRRWNPEVVASANGKANRRLYSSANIVRWNRETKLSHGSW